MKSVRVHASRQLAGLKEYDRRELTLRETLADYSLDDLLDDLARTCCLRFAACPGKKLKDA